MEIKHVEVELRYAGGMSLVRLTLDDVAALVALADRLRSLVPVSRATGSGSSVQPSTVAELRKMVELDKAIQRGSEQLWKEQAAETVKYAQRRCNIPAGVTHQHVYDSE